jgi:hypothetical protein
MSLIARRVADPLGVRRDARFSMRDRPQLQTGGVERFAVALPRRSA